MSRSPIRSILLAAVAATALVLVSHQAGAQDVIELPNVDVTKSRLGIRTLRPATPAPAEAAPLAVAPASTPTTIITGASTSVITAEDIARSPGTTLQDILSREPGIQTESLFLGVDGVGTQVDMRGFGVNGPSNTLVLINGRRLNDWDLTGSDLSAIPLHSIERVEITRGNSGAVLYGDGAVGGVINIVTKSSAVLPPSARLEAGFGSFRHSEVNTAMNGSSGPFSTSAYSRLVYSDGYRDNNTLRRFHGAGELRYTGAQSTAYFLINGDTQRLRTPGTRDIAPTLGINQLATNRRGTTTPFDFAEKDAVSATAGFTHMLWNGAELIVDGGARSKVTQFANFTETGFPFSYNDSVLTTLSLTPRISIDHAIFGMPTRILSGIDVYDTDYDSKRSQFLGAEPRHTYLLSQRSVAAYWQQTVTVVPSTDLSAGARLQWNSLSARDVFDPAAPPTGLPIAGMPLDDDEINHALHAGFEHRFNPHVAVFGRVARSFRVPNVDERVGQAPFNFMAPIPTNFDLRTQKSYDIEGGVRLRFAGLEWQTTVYDMRLTDELHFNPVTLANVNLDPTHRYGVESIATWRATDTLRFKAGAAYTRAVFSDGAFEGNDVPLVARWTGSVGVSWDLIGRHLVFDGTVRYVGRRYLDQDDANRGIYMVPAHTLVDVKLSGEIDRFFWSASIQNLFNVEYYNYGLDNSSPGFPYFNFYPLPGRTFMLRAGVNFR